LECNTPILPVRKTSSPEYGLVQNLREIDTRTVNVDPVMPNPHTPLASVPENNLYFAVLDVKDALSCLPVDEQSQLILAFEWESPTTRQKTRPCWTLIPARMQKKPNVVS